MAANNRLQLHLGYHSSVKIPTWVFRDVSSGPPVAPVPREAVAPALLAASALWNWSCTSCKLWASVKLGISEIGLWSSAMLPTMLILYVSYYWKVDASGRQASS
jgi:hypothetical protein